MTPVTGSAPDRSRRTVILLPLAAVLVAACAGIATWLVLVPPGPVREPDRTYAMWQVSKAVTAETSLRQALAGNAGPAPNTEVVTLADAFARDVQYLDLGGVAVTATSDPAIGAMIHRLDADQKQLAGMFRPRDDHALGPVARTLVDDPLELARMAEAVDREGAAFAEQDKNAADRQHWMAAGIIAALTAVSLLLIVLLDRGFREAAASRRSLDETATRLREALEAAARAEAAKSRFMVAATHDLRAPMETVIDLADTLLEDNPSSTQRETAGKMRDAGYNLFRALDDVMDYTTLEFGDLTLDERPFSPEAITAAAATGIESQARAKGLSVVATPAPGLPRLMVGDADRIGRILFRLASNAVRFTRKGGVSLQVLCVERDAAWATIEWVVSDTGIGIEPARLDHLFGPEAESVEADTEHRAGIGIGLEVCKRLIARMGGTLTVSSVVGEGSRFHVRLRLRVERRAVAREKTPPSAAPDLLREHLRKIGRRPRLLMAENTPAGQFILRQLLAREGIAPDIVNDGRAAVIAAESVHYDVICMELKMPEMDGLEATRRIRASRGPSANTPIIAVTASTSPDDVRASKDAGMTMFVGKPVRRETLLNAILAALTGDVVGPAPRPETHAAAQERQPAA